MRIKLTLMSVAILTLCASLTNAGTEGYEYVRSEPLTLLDLDVGNVSYDFSGNAEIPFTLSGANANVYLAIYTKDQDTPGGWGGPGHPAWNGGYALNRRAGIPNMVRVVECGQYDVGSGTCAWDGTDWAGDSVEPGTYTLYVLAVDNISDANWVAITGYGFRMRSTQARVWQGQGWMYGIPAGLGGGRQGGEGEGPRGHIDHPYGGGFMLYHIAPGNFLDADSPYDLIAGRVVEFPEYGLTNEDGSKAHILGGQAHGTAIDPEDFSRNWMYGYSNQGIIGVTVDWESQTSVPMEGFGQPPTSQQQQLARGDHGNLFFSIQYHNNSLYMGNGWPNDPPAAGIYEIDATTGEVSDVIDVSDFYVFTAYNEDGSTRAAPSMINCMEIDEQGFVMVAGGWGGGSSTRSPTKVDWDGNLIYMNDAGDGFNDMIFDAEAAALGVEPTTEGQAHSVSQSAEGFTFVTQGTIGEMNAQVVYGNIFGPDGAGIFGVDIDKAALSGNGATGSGTNMIHEHSDWDGLYILTAEDGWNDANGGYQVAHLPFRIEQALIGSDVTAVLETSAATPDALDLGDAYPNPFNAQTTIEFAIPVEGYALLTVYNNQGQKVSTLVNEVLSAGSYRTSWDGKDAAGQTVAGGLYFYRMKVGDYEQTKKMTLLK